VGSYIQRLFVLAEPQYWRRKGVRALIVTSISILARAKWISILAVH
jgi:hypothetical protein